MSLKETNGPFYQYPISPWSLSFQLTTVNSICLNHHTREVGSRTLRRNLDESTSDHGPIFGTEGIRFVSFLVVPDLLELPVHHC